MNDNTVRNLKEERNAFSLPLSISLFVAGHDRGSNFINLSLFVAGHALCQILYHKIHINERKIKTGI